MTNITRYNPFSEAVSLRDAMNHLFEESVLAPRLAGMASGHEVAANLYETTDGFTLQLPLPWVKPEEVDITVRQDVVTVQWETHVHIPDGAQVHWNSFQSGSYQQSITIPAPINSERVDARYENGILTLQLPKADQAKAHTIKVKAL